MLRGRVSKTAKHPSNQPALDYLRQISSEPRYANSPHFPRLFRRGMMSLAKCPLPIRTIEEAKTLSNVGDFLANMIAKKNSSSESSPHDQNAPVVDGTNSASSSVSHTENSTSVVAALHTADSTSTASGGVDSTVANRNRVPNTNKLLSVAPTVQRTRSIPINTYGDDSINEFGQPSTRQRAYNRAVREAEGVSATIHNYQNWKVILLLDKREQHRNRVSAKLLQSGVACEQRNLPIGDMLWIARGKRHHSNDVAISSSSVGSTTEQSVEVILGTVVERKTLADLLSSIYGTRFEEQRLRLKNSAAGANQVIYLLEAPSSLELPAVPPGSLRYAMMQTMVQLGFVVKQTKDLEETVRFLKKVHRRLIRRTFPSEFRNSTGSDSPDGDDNDGNRIIPLFASPNCRSRRLVVDDDDLVFHSSPVPFGADRLTLFDEFKAKIELARESGTRSLSSIFRATLKQVDTFSIRKVNAVTSIYETPSALISAYRERLVNGDNVENMLEDLQTSRRVRSCRIGPKSSAELAKVFTLGGKLSGQKRRSEHVSEGEGSYNVEPTLTTQLPSRTKDDETPKRRNNNAFIMTFEDRIGDIIAPADCLATSNAGNILKDPACQYDECSNRESQEECLDLTQDSGSSSVEGGNATSLVEDHAARPVADIDAQDSFRMPTNAPVAIHDNNNNWLDLTQDSDEDAENDETDDMSSKFASIQRNVLSSWSSTPEELENTTTSLAPPGAGYCRSEGDDDYSKSRSEKEGLAMVARLKKEGNAATVVQKSCVIVAQKQPLGTGACGGGLPLSSMDHQRDLIGVDGANVSSGETGNLTTPTHDTGIPCHCPTSSMELIELE